MKFFNKKLLPSLLVIVMLIPLGVGLFPSQAHGVFPPPGSEDLDGTTDLGADAQNLPSILNTGSTDFGDFGSGEDLNYLFDSAETGLNPLDDGINELFNDEIVGGLDSGISSIFGASGVGSCQSSGGGLGGLIGQAISQGGQLLDEIGTALGEVGDAIGDFLGLNDTSGDAAPWVNPNTQDDIFGSTEFPGDAAPWVNPNTQDDIFGSTEFGNPATVGLGSGGGIVSKLLGKPKIFVPVYDETIDKKTAVIKSNTTSIKQSTNALENKECVIDGLTTKLREVLISSMTRSIVNWINSGFDGEPAFITDLEGFMLDVGDQVIGDYIQGSELAFLCSPFKIDVRISIALDYYTTSKQRSSCTLSGVLENIEDAFGDFSSGNAWDQWFQLSINPHNNAFGSFINSRQSVQLSISNKQAEQQSILNWGRGIRSYEVCDTEGALDPNNSANISVGGVNCKIATPGVVINEQMSQVIGSGFRQLELADELDEIIGALLGQLSSKVFGGDGLSGLSNSSYSRPSYVNQLIAQSDARSDKNFQDFAISTTDGAIGVERQYLIAKVDTYKSLVTTKNLLGSLNQCYQTKLLTPMSSSDEQVATERMNTASSTVSSSINPFINLVVKDIRESEVSLSRLLVIEDLLLAANNVTSVERIIKQELDPLIKNKAIHTNADLNVALQQAEDVDIISDALDTDTNKNLLVCGAFPNTLNNEN